MTKETICIDLSQCTQEERKNIYKTLVDAVEKIFGGNDLDEEGNYSTEFPYLIFDVVSWSELRHDCGRTALSYTDFISFVKLKQTNPFKVGDKVYCSEYGWGEVESVSFVECTVKFSDKTRFVRTSYLSFTEYTMQGFTQERPIDYEQMAKDNVVGWFWDGKNINYIILGTLESYVKENPNYKFRCSNSGIYKNFLPLTPEEKAVLEKNELFKDIFKRYIMTKKEIIKEAWGLNYEDFSEHIDSDGWAIYPHFQKHEMVEDVRPLEFKEKGSGFRPKTLQGIENNNGWISLSGEPNEIEWVENLELYNIKTKEHYFCTDEHEFIERGRFTHYKPIFKSKPPIY